MRRIDYIRAMTIEEVAKAIIKHNITDVFCKSDCGHEDDCSHDVECCVNWLDEEDVEFKNKVWSDGDG